jgi:glycosyltransferase involved in cell wall biosynthesis
MASGAPKVYGWLRRMLARSTRRWNARTAPRQATATIAGVSHPTLDVLIVQASDPERLPAGGIASFIRGFVKFAPDDIRVQFAGLTTNPLVPVGQVKRVSLEGREIDFMPVARLATTRRRWMPATVPFVVGLVRYRRRLPAARLLQFHRPLTALPLLGIPSGKVRVVHLLTDQLVSDASESRWRRAGLLLNLVERLALQRMDRTYVVNERAAEVYRARFPELAPRIVYLPNWVDDSVFAAVSDSRRRTLRQRLTKDLGVDPRTPIVLFAGRLESQKDPRLAIEAHALAMREGRRMTLLVAGDGSLHRDLDEAIRHLAISDSVRFLGEVDRPQLAALMNGARALLISSHFETGPTVGLEALACGLPVVSTNVGTVAGLVREGRAGAVALDRSPRALADALASVLAQDEGELRARCVRTATPFHAKGVLGPFYDDLRAICKES